MSSPCSAGDVRSGPAPTALSLLRGERAGESDGVGVLSGCGLLLAARAPGSTVSGSCEAALDCVYASWAALLGCTRRASILWVVARQAMLARAKRAAHTFLPLFFFTHKRV